MRTELAKYQFAVVHCLNCGYLRLVRGPIPARYINTSTHECPECKLEKVRIRMIVLPIIAKMVIVRVIGSALAEGNKEDIYRDLLVKAIPSGKKLYLADPLRYSYKKRAYEKFMEGLNLKQGGICANSAMSQVQSSDERIGPLPISK